MASINQKRNDTIIVLETDACLRKGKKFNEKKSYYATWDLQNELQGDAFSSTCTDESNAKQRSSKSSESN